MTAEPRWRRWLANALPWCVWPYLAAVAAVWLLLRLGGDRWWFATLVLFGPRWLCALPLAVLSPAAGLLRRWMLVPLAAAALLVFGPVMGLCLPWARLTAPRGPALRVLTCNVKGACRDNAALDQLVRDAAPDIVALQGCFRQAIVKWPDGWHVVQRGELLIASRYPLRQIESPRPANRVSVLTVVVAAPEHDIRFSTLHPLSPHRSLGAVLDRRTVLRLSAAGQLEQEIEDRGRDAEQAAQSLEDGGESRIIVGDLNLPPDSAIYRKFWAGYHNAFSEAGLGFGYTEWPQLRRMEFGIRIDHVLSGPNWRPRRCWVGPDIGSDHLPLIADLAWAASADER
jgi:endonuclease/exonuclease/phosphatase (EEP) superfamily protein YafD